MDQAAQIIIVTLLGLVFGSFTSALSYRVARSLPWRAGRSVCPSCQTPLGVLDLVPIFSWLLLRGRCRHCRALIGWRYPLIELSILAACLGLYAAWGLTVAGVIAMAALPFLVTLILVDLEQMILPDSMQLILAGLGVFFVGDLAWNSSDPSRVLVNHAAAFVIFAGLIWLAGIAVSRLRRREALGFGDVKFMAVAGLWLGVVFLPYFMILSGLTGVLCALGWRLLGRGKVFPFGPALILAFYVCLVAKGAGFSGLKLLQ